MSYNITPESSLLKGWTVVVTGAASGLGRCAAFVAAYQGANVVLGDLNETNGTSTLAILQKEYPNIKAAFYKLDITNEDIVDEFMQKAEEEFGSVQGLLHCAGIFQAGAQIQDMPLSLFKREYEVNTVGTFLMNRAAVRQFLKQQKEGKTDPDGGYSVVNIGSAASRIGESNGTAYTSSKHGALGIVRAISKEQAKNNIRVNLVAPGPIDTPLMRNGMKIPLDWSTEQATEIVNKIGVLNDIMLKKLGSRFSPTLSSKTRDERFVSPAAVEDVGFYMVFLLGPRGKYVTHAMATIDGGWR